MPNSGASVEFAYSIDLFGYNLQGTFTATVDFNNILGSLKDIVISAVKSLASSLTSGLKRDVLITPIAISAPISDVCTMSVGQIGDSSALMFTTDAAVSDSSLPSCIFETFPNVSTLVFASVGLSGEIPDFIVPPSSILHSVSLANNTFEGSIPLSFKQLNLRWLDISHNQLTDGLNNLESSSALTYLDISYNNFTNDILDASVGDWIPLNFPNLRYFDLRGNQFNLSALEAIPLSKMSSTSVATAMRVNIDGNIVCGDCSIGVQLSGECHTHSCANATALNEVTSTILNYIESSGEVSFGGNVTILHTMRFCSLTTLFLIQYTNPSTPARSIVGVIDDLPNQNFSGSFVMNARSRTKCPPGRMGATCDYFCELGWQRQAQSDGMGGYVRSADSGSSDPADVYPVYKKERRTVQ